jgi:hypothetical protein
MRQSQSPLTPKYGESGGVQVGQVREYLMSNGEAYGTFRVTEQRPNELFTRCVWVTGPCAGQAQRFHEARIKQCAVVQP